MASIQKPMEEGFVGFLAQQRAIPGSELIKFVLSQFDSQGVEDVDIGTLATAKVLTLTPRGGTPLYDSIVKTIKAVEKRIKAEDVVLFVVITDGGNNEGSTALDTVRTLIAEKMDAGWAFIYLGANQDAWAVGGGMGLASGTTLVYAASAAGTADMYSSVNTVTTGYRTSKTRDQIKNLKVEDFTPDKDKSEK